MQSARYVYIVTKNNPYYPSVRYFVAIKEAIAQKEKWLRELADGGPHACQVTLALVISTQTAHTDD